MTKYILKSVYFIQDTKHQGDNINRGSVPTFLYLTWKEFIEPLVNYFQMDFMKLGIFNRMGIIINVSIIKYELLIIIAIHCSPLKHVFKLVCPSCDLTAETSIRYACDVGINYDSHAICRTSIVSK